MAQVRNDPSVRAILVHYRTADLLERAVASWYRFYPDIPLTLFDNAPDAADADMVASLRTRFPLVDYLPSPENIGHGPGMDRAIRHATEPFVFCLDSDTVVQQGGFLEKMFPWFDSPSVYGVGRTVRINRRGYNIKHEQKQNGFPALDPAHMLIRRMVYLSLPPFIQHGQPIVENFRAAAERGLELVSFDIESYILHDHRGTVQRHGYGLGLRGKINHFLNRIGL